MSTKLHPMKNNAISVFVPATVANVGPGFDVLGFAIEAPGDVLEMSRSEEPGIRICNETSHTKIPLEPEQNCTGKAVLSMLAEHPIDCGLNITMKKKIPPGSGLGSSAAAAVAGAVAANQLLGQPFTTNNLLRFALEGEKVASGALHADNVAPALMGGLVLVRSVNPMDVVRLAAPKNLFGTVLLPEMSIATEDARKLLPKAILLSDATKQWANVAGLVAGFMQNDPALIGRSMKDDLIEPCRAQLIPHFYEVQAAAVKAGALGCSISGAGPAMFALSTSPAKARKIGKAMRAVYQAAKLPHQIYAGQINSVGPKVLSTINAAASLHED
jgi:homoserine kinase